MKYKKADVLIGFIILICIALILYLSWLPKGKLGKETYLPQWILDWSNTNYNIRTGIPFFVLGYFIALKSRFWTSFSLCFGVVLLAEIGQFFLPGRHPDVMDVFYGALGALIGIGISKLIHRKSFEEN